MTIRVFAEEDAGPAAALFARVYPEHRWRSQAACESYFREMLFENPWRDPQIPSWVAEEHGRMTGFYAVQPRPMLLRGRPIRVAVGCQFIMDPDNRNSLAALQLTKACLSGPQDLTFADGANAQARRMWVAIGGTAPLLHALHWTRLLRPARYALGQLEARGAMPHPVALAARPFGALADSAFSRLPPNRFLRDDLDPAGNMLDPAAMLSHFSEITGCCTLQPAYDAASLGWLLDQAARKKRHGELRSRTVFGGKRKFIGWYLYYLKPGGVGEVVQIAARDGCFDPVLKQLMADAWNSGATMLHGRVEPRFAQELSDRHCWLRLEGPWTLIHSRHADILAAIQDGDAFLSRLEGEWWMRFQDG